VLVAPVTLNLKTTRRTRSAGCFVQALTLVIRGLPPLASPSRNGDHFFHVGTSAFALLQFDEETSMKNPTWDNSRPRGEEDAATEIDRLTREIRQTLDSIGQTQEQTARSR